MIDTVGIQLAEASRGSPQFALCPNGTSHVWSISD
jgi:hypothetical protein